MNMALGNAQADWLQARVADGTFKSLDDAFAQLVSERMELEDDRLEWVAPLLEEARRDVAENQTISLDQHRARNTERLARHGS